MAFIQCKLSSEVLQQTVDIDIYYPTDLPSDIGNRVKGVLTLLHGFSNSGSHWMQMTAAPRYAADNGLVIIAPSCQNSFYQNMVFGGAWKTFVTEEMPEQLHKIFKFPREREKNFIAGLSMGGFGALYLAMTRPDLYCAAASFSGSTDMEMLINATGNTGYEAIFGEEQIVPKESNLVYLAEEMSKMPAEQQVKLLLTCGKQDTRIYAIHKQNDAFFSAVKNLPISIKYMEWRGIHTWAFWDRSLVYAIDEFINPGYAAKKLRDWQEEPKIF